MYVPILKFKLNGAPAPPPEPYVPGHRATEGGGPVWGAKGHNAARVPFVDDPVPPLSVPH